jgi:hypothetical protein
MKRAEFEHAIRAAGAILGVPEVLVIGSQALHASTQGMLPAEASRSVEVDIAVLDDADGRLADVIDGAIGEASMFHSTFGYYAHGVAATTAVLPRGWRDRLVRYETPATAGVVAWCLEVHDLWIAKAIAGRPKDLEFCEALWSSRTVRASLLAERLATTDLDERLRSAVAARILGP